jgi:hypothetical protein
MAIYYLMNADAKVLEFSRELTDIGNIYELLNVCNSSELPLDFRSEADFKALFHNWVEIRAIPRNRQHMEEVISAINQQNRFDVLLHSHGLSLNDTYWIQEVSENLRFNDINLYDNPFDEALGWIAFTGLPSNISRHLSTPELTTEGMLPKYWQRITTSNIVLCKGGTEGYSNAGLEPYAEVIAYIISKHIGVNSIPYYLETRNKKPVSISKLFTSKEYGLLTANKYLTHAFPDVRYKSLDISLMQMKKDMGDIKPFYDMCFLDFIIENSDRHLNNWGFSIDNKTLKIAGFAPLWDNGMSLYYERDPEMRKKVDFASFNIFYNFVKTCEYRSDYVKKCSYLIRVINDGSLEAECLQAVAGFERYEKRVKPTLEFIKSNCERYLDVPSVSSDPLVRDR